MASSRVLGRVSSATGSVEELTAEQLRTLADVAQNGVLAGVNTRTASYTLVASDRGKVIEMNVAGANTVTLPNSTGIGGVNLPTGTSIRVVQIGSGATTISPAAGVSIQAVSGSLTTGGKNTSILLYKTGTNSWTAVNEATAYLGTVTSPVNVSTSTVVQPNLSTLLANTSLTYTTGTNNTVAPTYIIVTEAERFSYRVAASDATDHHLTTAGGVKLYVLPTSGGFYNFAAIAPAANGVTDDYPKLKKLLDMPPTPSYNPGIDGAIYKSSTGIYIPNGVYYMGQTIQLKASVHLFGDGSGRQWSGAATLKFPVDTVGIVINGPDTLGGTLEPVATGNGGASLIEGIQFTSTLGFNASAHGIWIRSRVVIRNVIVNNFGGNGIHLVASVGSTNPAEKGNANSWVIDTVTVGNVGGNGIYVSGSDVNAGVCRMLDVSEAHLWGVRDDSFLGNTWIACHTAVCGIAPLRLQTCFASYGGVLYHAVTGVSSATLGSTQPGTNLNVWKPYPGVTLPSDWVIAWTGSNPAGTYRPGGSYSYNNIGASVFLGCYSEDGQGWAYLRGRSIAVGCQFFGTPVDGPLVRGLDGYIFAEKYQATSTNLATNALTSVLVGEGSGTALTWSATDGGSVSTGSWRMKRESDGWFVNVNDSDAAVPYRLTGATNTYPYRTKFSRPPVYGNAVIGRMDYTGDGGTPFPTSGNYYYGDTFFAIFPQAGDYIGITCTIQGVAGSTAVFKKFGAVTA